MLLEDARGKTMQAVDIFAKSLGFMRNHLLKAVAVNLGYETDHDTIRWVITVPAIWDENAKQFMREAAYRVSFLLLCM